MVVATVFPARIVAPAKAAEPNRAVLIVDTGEQVKKVCVRFWEESISGADLLQRADVQAALRPFAGKGVAVCSLCGVGCRTDDSCLTCDPDGRYWAYSRAAAGSPDFRLSPAGASNTQVRNGDVEGWRWSRGASPTYISVAEVCDGAAPAGTATATTAPPATTVTTVMGNAFPAPAPTSTAVAPAGKTAPPVAATMPKSPLTAPAVTTSTVPAGVASSVATSVDNAAPPTNRRVADAPRSGSPAGLLVFASILVGLLGWAAVARRRRRPT